MLHRLLPSQLRRKIRVFLWKRLGINVRLASEAVIQIESPSDWEVFCEIFVNKEYDAAIEPVLSQAGKDEAITCLDLGSNIGLFSLRVVDLAVQQGLDPRRLRLFLVDASQTMIAELQRRASWATLQKANTTALLGLVGKRTGEGIIYENANHLYSSVNSAVGGHPATVPLLNLDEVTAACPVIHLLKCDIQGAEETFLSVYGDLLKRTRTAIIELHHHLCDTPACMAMLQNAGFDSMEALRSDGGVTVMLCRRANTDQP